MVDRDFLVDETGRMVIRNGTFATGESLTQEVGLILVTNKGEIRHDVFCGCDLLRRTNSVISRSEFERVVKVQLERDGKNWTDIKNGVTIRTNA
jgi:hypothetical protein